MSMRTLRVLVIGLTAFSAVSATGSAAVPRPNAGGPLSGLGSLPSSRTAVVRESSSHSTHNHPHHPVR